MRPDQRWIARPACSRRRSPNDAKMTPTEPAHRRARAELARRRRDGAAGDPRRAPPFSQAHLMVAARPSVAMLFRAVPGVDEIVTSRPRKHAPALAGDVGILFPNSFRSAWLLKRAGVKERWGYRSDFRGFLLTKGVRRPRRKVHFGEYYQHLVRELGVETGPLTPQLSVPPAAIEAAAKLLQARGWTPPHTLVALAPGAAFGHAKRWPPERFAALADALTSELGAVCVLLGRGRGSGRGHRLEASIRGGGRARASHQPDRAHRSVDADGRSVALPRAGRQRFRRAAPGRRDGSSGDGDLRTDRRAVQFASGFI